MAEILRGGIFSLALATAAVEDLRSRTIPDSFISIGMMGSLCLSADLIDTVLGAAVGFFTFWLIRQTARGKLGLGDVKLSMFIGSMLGPMAWWPAALLSAGAAVMYLVTAMALRRANRRTPVPFAPFLAFGALTVWAAGDRVFPLFLGFPE